MAGLDTLSVVGSYVEEIEKKCRGHLPPQVIEILCRLSEQQRVLEQSLNAMQDIVIKNHEAMCVTMKMTSNIHANMREINKRFSDPVMDLVGNEDIN